MSFMKFRDWKKSNFCLIFLTETPLPSANLVCVVCKDSFVNPWDLMVHAQAAHMINIYELGDATKTNEVNGHPVEMEMDKAGNEENGKDEGEGAHSEVSDYF